MISFVNDSSVVDCYQCNIKGSFMASCKSEVADRQLCSVWVSLNRELEITVLQTITYRPAIIAYPNYNNLKTFCKGQHTTFIVERPVLNNYFTCAC